MATARADFYIRLQSSSIHNKTASAAEWLESRAFFELKLIIGRLVVQYSMPSPLPIWISILQRHQRPVALNFERLHFKYLQS